MPYKHTTKSAAQIGKELGVNYILEGSLTRSGDRLRVRAQLIQVEDQIHIWAEEYDHNLTDALAMESGNISKNFSCITFAMVLWFDVASGSSGTLGVLA